MKATTTMLEFFLSPTFQIGFVLLLVVIVFFSLVRERLPADIVALLAMGTLMFTGILTVEDTLAVFSNAAPLTIAAMFVLSAALERTGVIDAAGRWVIRIAKNWSPGIAILSLMIGVILISAVINNTPVVVILIPVALRLAKAINLPASKLLIPLSFAAILGGTTTLIGTSTNILVDGVAQAGGLAPFGMFEITATGLIMALVGAAYMSILGPRLLPTRSSLAAMLPDHKERRFIAQILIPIDSVLIGRTLAETGFTAARDFSIIDVIREGISHRHEPATLVLKGGDRIVLRSPASEMLSLRKAGHIALGEMGKRPAFEPVQTSATVIAEGIIGSHSRLIGRQISGLGLARLYGVYLLAIHRHGENMVDQMDEIRLDIGDTVLLEGPALGMRKLFDDGMLNNLTETSERALHRGKAPIAITAVFLVMGLSALEILPIAALAIIAATAVVALGCLDHQEAYRSIRWDILMLIFGMLSLGTAMDKTGAASMIVGQLALMAEVLGPIAVLAALYFITSFLTEIISNNAAAILLTPIAIGLGQQMGIDPRPLVVAVMFAASASFATPIGYQTNTLVYSAGGYKFTDFIKIGLPLNFLMLIVAVLVIPIFWPMQ